jgi:hypothetical protein
LYADKDNIFLMTEGQRKRPDGYRCRRDRGSVIGKESVPGEADEALLEEAGTDLIADAGWS